MISFNAAISACGKCKQLERALSLLENMQQRGIEPGAISYGAVISACEKGGQWELAESLLQEQQQSSYKAGFTLF